MSPFHFVLGLWLASGAYAWCVVAYIDNGYKSRDCLLNWHWWAGASISLLFFLMVGPIMAGIVTTALVSARKYQSIEAGRRAVPEQEGGNV